MKQHVFVVPNGGLAVVWYFPNKKASRLAASLISRGLILAGAEYLGEL